MSEYTTYHKTQYQDDLNYTKQFIFSFGSNYALGTRLFNKRVREATIIFYAFVRYADEIVDNPDQKMSGQTHTSIDEFITEWQEVIDQGPTSQSHPIIRSNYWLFNHYGIPFEYTFDFLGAMKQDLVKERYATYAELEHYMWGSASIVGHVMTFIIGYSRVVAFENARALGEAMQLANFLRDVDEDYQERNRVYLPQNDMQLFGVRDHMIASQHMTPELTNFIRHYIGRTEKLFDQGIQGIAYLHSGKFSILLAARMYRENIRILQKRNYDIFDTRIRLTTVHKIWMLISTLYIYPYWLLTHRFSQWYVKKEIN